MTLAALCSWALAKFLLPADVDVAIIPTLGALAVRHFRHGKQDEHEPKHPAVKFLVAAWNEGDFSEAEKYVAPDCAVFMNGFAPDLGPNETGPAMAEESIGYWRSIVPDIKMELSQEIRAKDQIAIEWVLTGTHTGEQRADLPASGNAIEVNGSAFSDARRRQDRRGVVGIRLACPRSPDRNRRGAGLVAGAPRGLVGRGRESIDRQPGRPRRERERLSPTMPSAPGGRPVLTRHAPIAGFAGTYTRALAPRGASQDVLTEMALHEAGAHVTAA